MTVIQIIIGTIAIVASLVMLLRPDVADWLDDHTNLRAIAPENVKALEAYYKRKPVFRMGVPLGLLVIGLVFIIAPLTR